MNTAYLYRHHQLETEGTFGALFINDFSCFTLELPWRNNQKGNAATASCVPGGYCYRVLLDYSPAFRTNLYRLTNVPDRSGIRIHVANLAQELRGCIALGDQIVTFGTEDGICNSRGTLASFHRVVRGETFNLWVLYSLPYQYAAAPILNALDAHAMHRNAELFREGPVNAGVSNTT